ncbi:hypothetical protein EV121DRAFT_171506, partial [Schizophyllum commune]
PPLSLANNMWIGRIPWILQQLTVPEQLLISLLYPRVLVFKLRPKTVGAGVPETLQRGMRGNVSSYRIDLNGVVEMVEGDMLPRHPSILPAVLSITMVGVGPLPKNWMKTTFKVRRQLLRDALYTLKDIGNKYFRDVAISEERLALLPEDDVPEEL